MLILMLFRNCCIGNQAQGNPNPLFLLVNLFVGQLKMLSKHFAEDCTIALEELVWLVPHYTDP